MSGFSYLAPPALSAGTHCGLLVKTKGNTLRKISRGSTKGTDSATYPLPGGVVGPIPTSLTVSGSSTCPLRRISKVLQFREIPTADNPKQDLTQCGIRSTQRASFHLGRDYIRRLSLQPSHKHFPIASRHLEGPLDLQRLLKSDDSGMVDINSLPLNAL